MSTFTLEQCNDNAIWQTFISLSPQGTRYASTEIITELGCEAEFWFVMRKGYPVAGIPIITKNKASIGLPIHSYYVGLMFHPEAWNCKANRRSENVIAVSEFAMEALSKHYSHIEMCLHPDITDVRGFDWFNYHQPDKSRVNINPRYTAQVNLSEKSLREAARGSRRREENYADTRENLQFEVDGTPTELIDLWIQSLARQQNKLSDIEVEKTKQFAEYALHQKFGVIAVTRDENNMAQAAGLMLFDYNGLVHLPVVGTAETRYGGTLLYFKMMDYAAENGYKTMDFNGANSPNRAYFKHSIGGEARLYFTVSWDR